jgi:hypothetical protein
MERVGSRWTGTWLPETRMDGQTVTQKNSLILPAGFTGTTGPEYNLAAECRHLIGTLSRKIDTLCQECSGDPDRVLHIRSLTASLTTLSSLLRTLEYERTFQPERDFFEDARGFTYCAVRSCDIDRISNK